MTGCSTENKPAKKITALYEKRGITFDKETEICLVLPEIGCGGCIAGGVTFLTENKDKFAPNQKRNIVVFTAINSKKILYRTIDIKSPDELNCIVDSGNKYLTDDRMKLYPMLLKLKDSKIIDVSFQSPQNKTDIFQEIELK